MPLEIVVIDAFTDRPFAGNPAAVCVLDEPAEAAWMQAIAAEMNLAETAFVVPRGDEEFGLRWFTPTVEVTLCGHATLASAHLLFADGAVKSDSDIRFETRSGTLTCRLTDEGAVEMDFPADPVHPIDLPALANAVGAHGHAVFQSREWLLVEAAAAADVRALVPDMRTIATTSPWGVIVTAAGDREGIDCVSRVFAPAAGIDEDPVTGAAHCVLACYWGDKLGREPLVGEQASRRGGIVRMRRAGDRVVLAGHAVTVLRSTLVV